MDPEITLWLKKFHIQYKLYKHPAVFTVAEAQIHCGQWIQKAWGLGNLYYYE